MQQKAFYSITSAVARSAGRIVSPSALAVLRLTANSNVVGELDRQIGGVGAAEHFVDVGGRAPETGGNIGLRRFALSIFTAHDDFCLRSWRTSIAGRLKPVSYGIAMSKPTLTPSD